jgi:hypothetical protein
MQRVARAPLDPVSVADHRSRARALPRCSQQPVTPLAAQPDRLHHLIRVIRRFVRSPVVIDDPEPKSSRLGGVCPAVRTILPAAWAAGDRIVVFSRHFACPEAPAARPERAGLERVRQEAGDLWCGMCLPVQRDTLIPSHAGCLRSSRSAQRRTGVLCLRRLGGAWGMHCPTRWWKSAAHCSRAQPTAVLIPSRYRSRSIRIGSARAGGRDPQRLVGSSGSGEARGPKAEPERLDCRCLIRCTAVSLPSRKRHEPESILEALRLFDADLPPDEPRSLTRYSQWAAGYLKKAHAAGLRIPLSGLTMSRAFGSWNAALDAAGISVPAVVRSRPAKRWTSRADAARALQAAAAELDLPLTVEKYNHWAYTRRVTALSDDGAAANDFPTPSASAIARHFGGLRRAIKECLGSRARGSRSAERIRRRRDGGDVGRVHAFRQ